MTRPRALGVAGLVAVALVLAMVVGGGSDRYMVRAQLKNAGGLRAGFKVRVDGVPVGTIKKVELGRGDVAIAEAEIEDSAAPLGRDARATVRAINILGEKYLDVEPGDQRNGAPSGVVIPVTRTAGAVELDDVIDAVDLPTRAALEVVLDEAGRGLDGHDRDLAAALAALPPALDRTGELLRQLGADNRSLGRLVDSTDRVVAGVAAERASLGRVVAGAADTFDALGDKRRELGQTVEAAPGTIAALRRALVSLEDASVPLGPAARGLRSTAAPLTATLRELPPTAQAARPALRAAQQVAPALDRLGARGTPVARRLRPLARQLATWSSDVAPATRGLDVGFADLLGVMEAWARATAPRDGAGHIFRLAVGGGADLLESLAARPPAPKRRDRAPAKPGSPALTPAIPKPSLPRPQLPEVRLPGLPRLPEIKLPLPRVPVPSAPVDDVHELLDYLLGP